MVYDFFFSQVVLLALVWLCLMLQWAWPSDCATAHPTPPRPTLPRRKRSREPKPFVGLTTKPPCDACAHADDSRPHAPAAPPPRIVMTRGRRRQIDTSHHFCPNPDCAYRGWVGWGNLRANGRSCPRACNFFFRRPGTFSRYALLTWVKNVSKRWSGDGTPAVRGVPHDVEGAQTPRQPK